MVGLPYVLLARSSFLPSTSFRPSPLLVFELGSLLLQRNRHAGTLAPLCVQLLRIVMAFIAVFGILWFATLRGSVPWIVAGYLVVFEGTARLIARTMREHAAAFESEEEEPSNLRRETLEDRLNGVGWAGLDQPTSNDVDAVPDAIRALAAATKRTRESAQSRFLSTIGNNHAGTYDPVVLVTMPFLQEILESPDSKDAARTATLDVLVDLLGSFSPTPEHELIDTDKGRRPLHEVLVESARSFRPVLKLISKGTAPPTQKNLAKQVLSLTRKKPAS